MEVKSLGLSHLLAECAALIEGEPNRIANMANIASLLYHSVDDLNWCGFYLQDADKDELILGPFQGRPACIRIPKSKGVCGRAWREGRVINVPDVTVIADHIVCDSETRSELVLPVFTRGKFQAVLDLDSPLVNRFDHRLESLLSSLAREILPTIFEN